MELPDLTEQQVLQAFKVTLVQLASMELPDLTEQQVQVAFKVRLEQQVQVD